ncbi:MAG: TPM domain-containing protein [Acidobacteria bacterium]|nr:TPM domain-containing protein [Acidobacteriota bacterium]
MGENSTKAFFENLDRPAIVEAIRRAEARSFGEIRVHLHHGTVADARLEAESTFLKLGMDKTARGSGCLIFIAPASRKFAVVGGTGIHERVGDGFWLEARDATLGPFREGRFTEGIVGAVGKLGDALALFFPKDGVSDRNELPDDVSED